MTPKLAVGTLRRVRDEFNSVSCNGVVVPRQQERLAHLQSPCTFQRDLPHPPTPNLRAWTRLRDILCKRSGWCLWGAGTRQRELGGCWTWMGIRFVVSGWAFEVPGDDFGFR